MNSTTKLRAMVGVTTVGCLLAAVGPATAATTPYPPFPVSVEVAGGTRNFTVDRPDSSATSGFAPLTGFDFGLTDRSLPFRVTVADAGVPLAGEDYRVSATMSNLYYVGEAGTDYSTKIPSSALSLSYSALPTASDVSLPIVPRISLTGNLSCSSLSVGEILGAVLEACNGLLSLLSAGGAVNTAANGAVQELTEADLVKTLEDVASLPFGLTGAQESGAFVSPAKMSSGNDPEPGTTATAKTIMKGTNLLTGDTLTGTASRVDAALDAALVGVPVLPKGGTGSLLSTNELLTALSQQASLAGVVEDLQKITDQTVLAKILAGVTGVVNDVTVNQLSVMSGTYRSLPTLSVDPVTIRAGVYEGEMTVDFFQE